MMKPDLNRIKTEYPIGTRIRLIRMCGEPHMSTGLLGTVEFVDDIGQIHVKWNNGSSLALNVDVDEFETLK